MVLKITLKFLFAEGIKEKIYIMPLNSLQTTGGGGLQ